MQALPILQSGYIAKNELNLVKGVDESKNDSLKYVLTNQVYKNKFIPYFHNTEVDSLFTRFLTDRNNLSNFDFREKILKTTKEVFNNSFRDFILTQTNSPFLTVNHAKFLIDTMAYIGNGQKRTIDVQSWLPLIGIKGNDNRGVEVLRNFLNNEGCRSLYRDIVLHADLAETISYWTRWRHGFVDLLYTLKIIFGKKVERMLV